MSGFRCCPGTRRERTKTFCTRRWKAVVAGSLTDPDWVSELALFQANGRRVFRGAAQCLGLFPNVERQRVSTNPLADVTRPDPELVPREKGLARHKVPSFIKKTTTLVSGLVQAQPANGSGGCDATPPRGRVNPYSPCGAATAQCRRVDFFGWVNGCQC
jgi:hypothetical protein